MRAIALVFAALMFFVIAGCGDKGVQEEKYVRVTGTVYGRVTDAETGFAVRNAEVTIVPSPRDYSSKMIAFTDENGEYRRYFALNVPAQSLIWITNISVDHTGYEYYLAQVAFTNDSEFRVDIELEGVY
jgi:hypothetical protein